jgi:hypothetical protein
MQNDLRSNPRFEPPFVDAIISFTNGETMRSSVLDASRGGLAVALSENADLPSIGQQVTLRATTASESSENSKPVGTATILRNWAGSGLLNEGKGLAMQFNSAFSDQNTEQFLLRGVQQKTRLTAQAELATVDMNYLGGYRRDIVNCQMKLYVLNLTIGVALAGAYFGLTYHSIAINQLSNPQLSFWRTMLAALPGLLSVACVLMVSQKSISIQRLDAFLAVLKECSIMKQYPREYRGWETAYRKYRHVLRTNACTLCKVDRKCGDLKIEERNKLVSKSMFRNPKIDTYHIIMYMSFFIAFLLSIIAITVELLKFQWGVHSYMAIAFTLGVIVALTVITLFYVFYHLRKGHYSLDQNKRCWLDILNKCRC